MVSIIWRHATLSAAAETRNADFTVKSRKQAKRVTAWLREWLPRDATVLTISIARLAKMAWARRSLAIRRRLVVQRL
jgi:hypothetical protein